MNNRITVQQASKVLGLSPDYIHHHMRKGDLPIGHVMQSGGKQKSRRTYLIYMDMIEAFIGKKEKPIR